MSFLSAPEFITGALLFIVLASLAACYWLARKATYEPEPAYRVRFDVDPLAPEPFVDAVPAPLIPKEKTVAPRCWRCGAAMVLSPRKVCWMCSCTSSDGGKAA